MTMDSKTADKVAAAIRLLGSESDGEALAAARALQRLMKDHGGLHALAEAVKPSPASGWGAPESDAVWRFWENMRRNAASAEPKRRPQYLVSESELLIGESVVEVCNTAKGPRRDKIVIASAIISVVVGREERGLSTPWAGFEPIPGVSVAEFMREARSIFVQHSPSASPAKNAAKEVIEVAKKAGILDADVRTG